MVGTCAKESLIWEVLQKLGVQVKKKYRIFGNLKKVITQEFVQLGYLEYKPVNHSSPLEYAFFWGPKANQENSKMEILQFVAKAYNADPWDWPLQYSEAVKQMEARAKAKKALTGVRAQACARVRVPAGACASSSSNFTCTSSATTSNTSCN